MKKWKKNEEKVMSEELEKAQDILLGKVNQLCAKFGLNNVMAQLYIVLYLQGKSMSLDAMVERLKISKGSVSVNIRALERYGAVRKVWVKGSRKDFYEVETDISRLIIERVKSMIQGRLSEVKEAIDASHRALNSIKPVDKEERESIKVFNERLNQLNKVQNKARGLFNLFNSSFLNKAIGLKTKRNNKEEMVEIH
ncbi:MAG: hypothetical protein JSV93_05340 [Candidatus Omnitrophota bacterium]|nr:MAG: hypothetical protein JSV93_05340 [Candidatus Omnitrophota bacterium]